MSSSFIKKFSRIPERSKLGVYGWIREADRELQLSQAMPLMISNICIMYYFDQDIFDDISWPMVRTASYKYVRAQQHVPMGYLRCNAFGFVEIDSMSGNKYRWDIKLKQIDHKCEVGIISTKNMPNRTTKLAANKQIWDIWDGNVLRSYTWIGYGGKFENQRSGIQNQMISIHLDLEKRKIRFVGDNANMYKKEIDYKKEIEIGPDIKYKLVVTMHFKNDCFKIENFKQIM